MIIVNSSVFQLLHDKIDALFHLIFVGITGILNITDWYSVGTEEYHDLEFHTRVKLLGDNLIKQPQFRDVKIQNNFLKKSRKNVCSK